MLGEVNIKAQCGKSKEHETTNLTLNHLFHIKLEAVSYPIHTHIIIYNTRNSSWANIVLA